MYIVHHVMINLGPIPHRRYSSHPGHCIVPAGVAYRHAGLYDSRLGARPLMMVYKLQLDGLIDRDRATE